MKLGCFEVIEVGELARAKRRQAKRAKEGVHQSYSLRIDVQKLSLLAQTVRHICHIHRYQLDRSNPSELANGKYRDATHDSGGMKQELTWLLKTENGYARRCQPM